MWKDITMPLFNGVANFPGDTAYNYRVDATLDEDGANVGSVQFSVHIGTHVDAPFHYDAFGKSIDALPVDLFIGDVLIVDATHVSRIDEMFVSDLVLDNVKRVFFKTRTTYVPYKFLADYKVVTASAIHLLAKAGVQMIGVDTPSIDAVHDAQLPAHHACRETGLLIIENLWLQNVEAGSYEFIGLPLPFQGADASPIRAVIQKRPQYE